MKTLSKIALIAVGITYAITANAQSCDKKGWQTIREDSIKVWKRSDNPAFFFKSKMTIDADGSPRAYNPPNTGLDHICNACACNHNQPIKPWNCYGIVLVDGQPYIQGANDPAPGYYVSPTSLVDRTRTRNTDPRRYVDSEKIPYIALPPEVINQQCRPDGKACLGDIGFVLNTRNGRSAFVIVADQGPRNKIGEGSIALARALDINSSPINGGVNSASILYLVFPKSGNGSPKSVQQINSAGSALLQSWGGQQRLEDCLNQHGGG
ncbi:glycoside hydrolase family 75 protein [Pannus brasiliensis CCIBt3594]|uniref:Glycoside hydrolase family 75 protein n=1 Tax=Pannus brasiliensis CCIBt3594 TaxID=1427578 RepID=A0AAW9QGV9_9CHRO